MIEGKNEEMSTSELSGGARIHYIFQSIFVKSLEVCSFGMNFSLDAAVPSGMYLSNLMKPNCCCRRWIHVRT